MFGAILGDIIGSPFEFDMGDKSKKFPLFSDDSMFTDDTVMTLAVFYAFFKFQNRTENKYKLGWYYTHVAPTEENMLKDLLCESMQYWGRKYPYAGYGGNFNSWLYNETPIPYNSFGNGSAMRVSSVGWYAKSLEETELIAKVTAEVSHNHPEGIKGAVATAGAVFLARTGSTMDEIKQYISKYYSIDFTIDEIRPLYDYDITCQGTVPQAMQAFFESESFEDAIRNAISIGGDSDTLAAITGAVAEAYYGIPDDLKETALSYLDERLLNITERFEEKYII